MEEIYECQMCGEEKTEDNFVSDLDRCMGENELTCESCYDEMNE